MLVDEVSVLAQVMTDHEDRQPARRSLSCSTAAPLPLLPQSVRRSTWPGGSVSALLALPGGLCRPPGGKLSSMWPAPADV